MTSRTTQRVLKKTHKDYYTHLTDAHTEAQQGEVPENQDLRSVLSDPTVLVLFSAIISLKSSRLEPGRPGSLLGIKGNSPLPSTSFLGF